MAENGLAVLGLPSLIISGTAGLILLIVLVYNKFFLMRDLRKALGGKWTND